MTKYYPNLIIILFVIVAIWLWFWTQRLVGKKVHTEAHRVFDRVHVWSEPLNRWLNNNSTFANALLIATSLVIDITALFLIGVGIFGSSLRTLLALVIVMAFRQACHFVSSLPTPPGIIWRYPGFPSLFVTYEVGNDFFFSGHTAIAMLGALQFIHSGNMWLIIAAFVVVAVQLVSVLALRAHYTIDVFAAIFVAWVANSVATQVAPMLDLWIHNLF